jgi:hypothetical protein
MPNGRCPSSDQRSDALHSRTQATANPIKLPGIMISIPYYYVFERLRLLSTSPLTDAWHRIVASIPASSTKRATAANVLGFMVSFDLENQCIMRMSVGRVAVIVAGRECSVVG